jgi:acyl carrier protein
VTALESTDRQDLGEQLNVKPVAADDHFFLLGGNSIAATQVIARVREELGSGAEPASAVRSANPRPHSLRRWRNSNWTAVCAQGEITAAVA